MTDTCIVCGRSLPPRRRAYCSDQCRTKHWMNYYSKLAEDSKKVSGSRTQMWGWIRHEKLSSALCCERCGRLKGSDESLEVHHRVAVSVGGTNELTNLIVLCKRCHRAEHKGKPRGGKANTVQGMLVIEDVHTNNK